MKRKIKGFFDKKRILVLSLCLVVFVMSLGYAALSQYVELDGIASIDRSWIVKVTNVTNTTSNGASSISSNYVSNTVTLNANLPTSSSTITYTITLSNQGNIPAKLNDIEIIEDENSNITYEISGVLEEVTTLAPGETNTAKVTIKYKNGVTNISETKKELMLTFIYVENSGTTGGNSGDSTSDTENVVYQPGEAVMYNAGNGEKLYYIVTTNDTTSATTVQMIADEAVTTSTASGAQTALNNYANVYYNKSKVLTKRLPTMEEIAKLSGIAYDANKDYSASSEKFTIAEWLIGSKAGTTTLTSTMKGSNYYIMINAGGSGTITQATGSQSGGIRPVITVAKTNLEKYERYEVGEKVELIDGTIWYVTKDSGTGNAMVTLMSENLAASNGSVAVPPSVAGRSFDSNNTNEYDPYDSNNIGYYVKNTVESYIKNSIKNNGGKEASTKARLLTKEEYDKITKKGSEIPSWVKVANGYGYWLMTKVGSNVYYFNGSSLSQATPTSYYRVRPVITTLKSNLKPTVYLKDQILEDNNEQSDSNIDFSQISSSTNGQGLYYTNTNTEDNKTTYYFRGAVENNYVEFAGFYWRIIRINEDGSIRLIYQGTTPDATGEAATIGTSKFNASYLGNAYVGYMYGTNGSSSYVATHANTNSSTVKQAVDTWYEENLLDYASYLADAGFCGDRTLAEGTAGNGYSNATGYASPNRLENPATPQFSCPQSNDLYTTSSSSKGNKALDYPIGLISLDEVSYAGGLLYNYNNDYYLNIGDVTCWAISPSSFNGNYVAVGTISSGGVLNTTTASYVEYIRPVINLSSSVKITTGNGTTSRPYTIK